FLASQPQLLADLLQLRPLALEVGLEGLDLGFGPLLGLAGERRRGLQPALGLRDLRLEALVLPAPPINPLPASRRCHRRPRWRARLTGRPRGRRRVRRRRRAAQDRAGGGRRSLPMRGAQRGRKGTPRSPKARRARSRPAWRGPALRRRAPRSPPSRTPRS